MLFQIKRARWRRWASTCVFLHIVFLHVVILQQTIGKLLHRVRKKKFIHCVLDWFMLTSSITLTLLVAPPPVSPAPQLADASQFERPRPWGESPSCYCRCLVSTRNLKRGLKIQTHLYFLSLQLQGPRRSKIFKLAQWLLISRVFKTLCSPFISKILNLFSDFESQRFLSLFIVIFNLGDVSSRLWKEAC